MVIDKETNQVFFSSLLLTDCRFEDTFNRLSSILKKHQIEYNLLKETKDIWCRDYMPIQKGKSDFIQFRYEPSYLFDYTALQSDPKAVLKANNIKATYSTINIDGGNVLRWTDRVILTDRFFSENPNYSNKLTLIEELEQLFEAEVIVIPEIKSDMTGHADGLVRFYNRTTLIGNRLQNEYLYWQKAMKKVIANYGFDYIELPFFEYKSKNNSESAIGCYTNYLEVGNLIVLPIFEVAGNRDEETVRIISEVFSDRKVETININEIAMHGGLLNCITWTI